MKTGNPQHKRKQIKLVQSYWKDRLQITKINKGKAIRYTLNYIYYEERISLIFCKFTHINASPEKHNDKQLQTCIDEDIIEYTKYSSLLKIKIQLSKYMIFIARLKRTESTCKKRSQTMEKINQVVWQELSILTAVISTALIW